MSGRNKEKITVARLGPSDLKEALFIVLSFWDEPPEGADLQNFLDDAENVLLAGYLSRIGGGELAGGLVGYVLKRWDGKAPMLFLYSIDVLEGQRRVDVASALIREFNRIGREAGCRKALALTDEGNHAAMALYVSSGARRPRRDDVLYEWEL